VIALLNRITASTGDSEKQPAGVRVRLRAKMLNGGKPADMEGFIAKILQQAAIIYAASEEIEACGIHYRPLSQSTQEPTMGKRALKLEANRLKNKANAKGRLPGFGGGGALPKEFVEFVCNGCGGKGHAYKQCPLADHKDFNKGHLGWAKSDAGKRLKALGKSAISADAPAGAKQQRGECNHVHDAPHLAALCTANDSYLVAGSLTGSCDANTTNESTTALQVRVLLDTGAVVDNYGSKAVGDWMRQNAPASWSEDSSSEPVGLAAIGTATEPLGSVNIDLILRKDDDTNVCVLKQLKCTIVDLPVDLIVGRPTIRSSRIVRALPDYFIAPSPPDAHPTLSQRSHRLATRRIRRQLPYCGPPNLWGSRVGRWVSLSPVH
jgi:hypothetical protein